MRRAAVRRALFDRPNERSLHSVPTPRLGGVAILVPVLVVAAVGWMDAARETRALAGSCAAVALLGLRDDLRPLSVAVRLPLQLLAAAAFLWLVGTPPFLVGPSLVLAVPAAVTFGALVVWIVGVLNITNFMDGMDGLAGSQSVAAFSAMGVVVTLDTTTPAGVPSVVAAIVAASAGFLAHNSPPARIFMGDAGATFLGFAFAGLAVVGMHHGIPITTSALALSPFLLDGTFTIVRRARRGERIWRAHRSHLYQRAVQTGLGHRDVLLVYLAWIAAAAGAAIASSAGVLPLVAGWLVSLGGLVAVWRWVVRCEARARVSSDRA